MGVYTKLKEYNIDKVEAGEKTKMRFGKRGTQIGEYMDIGASEAYRGLLKII